MVDTIATTPIRPPTRKGKGQYYTPAAVILEVPGVKKVEGQNHLDIYFGTAEALVRTGLATLDMFPGQPGRPVGTATYQPSGHCERASWWAPGYMTIFRKLDGNFRIQLTVSLEEQAKREGLLEVENARRQQANKEAKAKLELELELQRAKELSRFKAGDRARVFTEGLSDIYFRVVRDRLHGAAVRHVRPIAWQLDHVVSERRSGDHFRRCAPFSLGGHEAIDVAGGVLPG